MLRGDSLRVASSPALGVRAAVRPALGAQAADGTALAGDEDRGDTAPDAPRGDEVKNRFVQDIIEHLDVDRGNWPD